MKSLRWLALLLGLGAIAMLIVGNGVSQLGSLFARGGFKLLVVPVAMVIPMMLDAKGWQVLIPNPPPWRQFFYARWIGESVNTLLPVAQVGGLFVKSYLLEKRMDRPGFAIASAIASDTVSAVSLLFFIACSLALMAVRGIDLKILLPLAFGTVIFCVPVYLFYRLQRTTTVNLPPRLRKWGAMLTAMVGITGDTASIKAHLEHIYCDKRGIFKSFILQLFGWLLGTIEVWIIVHLFGGTLSVTDALILEGSGQAVRNIAFFIPGALGLQEGVYVIVGTVLGLPPILALSISLVKRFRELAQGIPGLIVWQAHEGWSLLHRPRRG